jgi:cobalt transporter subunit CbtB
MTPTTAPQAVSTPIPVPAPIPVRQLLPWAAFALLIGVILVYFVGAEGGATSLVNGTFVHELTHDGRHLLGFPCH